MSTETKRIQVVRGVVTSDKMDKTRVISVVRRVRHGRYTKRLMKDTTIFIHDEKNESKSGDTVLATACRRFSKNKSFRLSEVVTRGSVQDDSK